MAKRRAAPVLRILKGEAPVAETWQHGLMIRDVGGWEDQFIRAAASLAS